MISLDRAELHTRDHTQSACVRTLAFAGPEMESEMAKGVAVIRPLMIDNVIQVTCQEPHLYVGRCCLGPLAEPDRPPFKRLYARALGSTSAQEQRQAQAVRFPPLATLQRYACLAGVRWCPGDSGLYWLGTVP